MNAASEARTQTEEQPYMESLQDRPADAPYLIDPAGADLDREYETLRGQGPLVRVELPGEVEAWAVTSGSLLRELLTDARVSKDARRHWPRFQNGEIGAEWPLIIWIAVQNMFTAYGDQHRRLRRLIAPAFTARRARTLGPRIEEIVGELLDGLAATPPGQAVDLREGFAFPLPIQVICELMGLPDEHRAGLRTAVNNIFDTTISPEDAAASSEAVYGILGGLVEAKRAEPGDDLVSDLIAQRAEDGSRLTEQELLDTLLLVISAGYETTVNLLDQAVYALLTDPAQLDHVREGRATWDDVIDETLRVKAPVPYLPLRYAVEDIDLTETTGIVIRQGEAILAAYGAAGTDPDWHGKNASEFDATRESHDHLAFGHGTHLCLGAPLARLEAATGLPALFSRFPQMRLACPPGKLGHVPSFVSNGHDRLPVVLAPAG